MTNSYSCDLRERVILYVEAGHSCRAAGRAFNVSASFVIKLMMGWRKTGSLAPARQGRPPGNGKLAPYRGFLIGRIEEQPDITLPELAGELNKTHGVRVYPASLSRFLRAAGFTYKKNAAGNRARTFRRLARPACLDNQAPTENAA